MNHSIEELIEKRASIRSFRVTELSEGTVDAIQDYFAAEKKLIDVKAVARVYRGDTGKKLEGVVGYRGYAFNAPAYVVLLSEEKEGWLENLGFLAEGLTLKLEDIGLDSCWLTVEDGDRVKEALDMRTPLSVGAVIAFGFGKAEKGAKRLDILTPADVKFTSREGHIAPKIAQNTMVYEGTWGTAQVLEEDQYDPYLDKALYAASLAPSFLNRQTYRYLLAGKYVYLCEKQEEMVSEADRRLGVGATMYNFQAVYEHYTHIGEDWVLGAAAAETADREALGIPAEYEIEGRYRLF